MKQRFYGDVALAAGRDMIVVQMPAPLTHEECDLVRAYRAAPCEGRKVLRQVARALMGQREARG